MAPVSVIVLNWNQPDHTMACVQSVLRANHQNRITVLVIDNGSSDDSVNRIRAGFRDVLVIETGANLGYAGGNNIGIRHALFGGSEAICILNNDVIVDPTFLDPLLTMLQKQPEVGIVTPLIGERTEKGAQVWALGSTINWNTAAVTRNCAGEPIAHWRNQPPFEVDVASGAAMLVRREVLQQVGLMDEEFFLYFEEVDWSLAVRQAGYRILAVPASLVWHDVSATLGATSPVIDYYMLRNHLRLISRHCSGMHRNYLWSRVALRNLLTIAAFSVKSQHRQRIPNRNARLLALRDAHLGRWGKMGQDVEKVCYLSR